MRRRVKTNSAAKKEVLRWVSTPITTKGQVLMFFNALTRMLSYWSPYDSFERYVMLGAGKARNIFNKKEVAALDGLMNHCIRLCNQKLNVDVASLAAIADGTIKQVEEPLAYYTVVVLRPARECDGSPLDGHCVEVRGSSVTMAVARSVKQLAQEWGYRASELRPISVFEGHHKDQIAEWKGCR